MFLSDRDIKARIESDDPTKRLVIQHLGDLSKQLGPQHLDLRLSARSEPFEQFGEINEGLPGFVGPGKLYQCLTTEYIELPDDLCAILDGQSLLARHGIRVHQTAQVISAGFKGFIQLEVDCVGERGHEVLANISICKLLFAPLSSAAERPYGHPDRASRFQNQQQLDVPRVSMRSLVIPTKA